MELDTILRSTSTDLINGGEHPFTESWSVERVVNVDDGIEIWIKQDEELRAVRLIAGDYAGPKSDYPNASAGKYSSLAIAISVLLQESILWHTPEQLAQISTLTPMGIREP